MPLSEEREKIVLLHRKLARRRRLQRFWAPVLTTCVACFLLFHVLIGISVVSGVSMMPSQNPGDLVLYLRQWVGVELGDMVVLSGVTEVDMVKRVVGVSGDEIAVTEDGHITRNGLEQSEPTVWYGWQDSRGWQEMPTLVPAGHIFCMGDNRPISLDSRNAAVGAIPLERVKGKVLLTLRLQ